MGINPSPALTGWATKDKYLSLSGLAVCHLLDKKKQLHSPPSVLLRGQKGFVNVKANPEGLSSELKKNTLLSFVSRPLLPFFLVFRLWVAEADLPLTGEELNSGGKKNLFFFCLKKKTKKTNAFPPRSRACSELCSEHRALGPEAALSGQTSLLGFACGPLCTGALSAAGAGARGPSGGLLGFRAGWGCPTTTSTSFRFCPAVSLPGCPSKMPAFRAGQSRPVEELGPVAGVLGHL